MGSAGPQVGSSAPGDRASSDRRICMSMILLEPANDHSLHCGDQGADHLINGVFGNYSSQATQVAPTLLPGPQNFVKVLSLSAATATDGNLSSSISARALGTFRCIAGCQHKLPSFGLCGGPSYQVWMPREYIREPWTSLAGRTDELKAGHRNAEAIKVGSAGRWASFLFRQMQAR
jgi:hypothetical protein